ncbi:hypothetical protein T492DRAFT_1151005, partial [Pavlovales sp. CCMP2436]
MVASAPAQRQRGEDMEARPSSEAHHKLGLPTSDDNDDERVPRLAMSSITPREFESRFVRTNRPCILIGVGSGWRACREWADAGRAIFEPLRERFGEEEVTVHDCSKKVLGRYRTSEMRLDALFALWERGEVRATHHSRAGAR